MTPLREDFLTRINECLVGFGPDSLANISRLAALCGGLLEADAVVYARLDKGILSAVGQWRVPPDFNPILPLEESFGEEVLRRMDEPVVACRLPDAGKGTGASGFRSCAGRAVRSGDQVLGVVYALFKEDPPEGPVVAKILGLVAAAVAGEETRLAGEKTRCRLAEQLRQAQKMEAIGRLAGGIAHDFNNTLTTIKGYAEIIASSRDQESKADAGEILKAVDFAASLTRQLLAFSRRQMLLPRIVDLNAVVRGTARMLQRLIGEHIALDTKLEPGEARVFADPAQLEQVLINLAINARDAMPDGGRLLIRTEIVAPESVPTGEDGEAARSSHVRLTVADTGVGISPELLPRLFEPFFTTKEQGKGTGLGLATVYGVVAQSGGRVTCESAPGCGAAFLVYLPLRAEPLPPADAAPSAASLRGKGLVLLVEDDAGIRGMTERVLKAAGYDVATAACADDALKLSSALVGKVDALVTDVVMPGLNGRQLAMTLEKARPDLKIVYMSGYTDDDALRGALRRGAVFLQKPFNPSELCRVLREVMAA